MDFLQTLIAGIYRSEMQDPQVPHKAEANTRW